MKPKLHALVLLLPAIVAAQTPHADIVDFETRVNTAMVQIPHLRSMSLWLLTMVLVTIVSGAAVTALQQYERKWVKQTTILLGAIVAIVGGLKATLFAIDYRTYDQVIPQMEETITLLQGEFREYVKDATSDTVRADLFKRMLANDQKLVELRSLLYGSTATPPHLFIVAFAQAQQSGASGAPYYTLHEQGKSFASNEKAAYEYARWQAFDGLADQVTKKLSARPGVSLVEQTSLTLYVAKFAEVVKSDCHPEGSGTDQMFRCMLDVSLNSAYLQPAVVSRFVKSSLSEVLNAPKPPSDLSLSASSKVSSTAFSITLSPKGKKTAKSFEFIFVQRPSGDEVELREIRSFESGVWTFSLEARGITPIQWLGLRSFDNSGRPTVFREIQAGSLKIAPKTEIKVSGTRWLLDR